MATTVVLAGANFSIPSYGDSGWSQGAGNLSAYFISIASVTLQTTGGNFTLTADTNFGATFGLVSTYFKSRTVNIATAGALRLAKTDAVEWRNNANGGNLPLAINGSDQLTYNGAIVVTSSVGPTPVEYRVSYVAGTASGTYTGSLTVVNLPNAYVANGVNIKVFANGLLTQVTRDYTETSTTAFTFTSPLVAGDSIDAFWTIY